MRSDFSLNPMHMKYGTIAVVSLQIALYSVVLHNLRSAYHMISSELTACVDFSIATCVYMYLYKISFLYSWLPAPDM